MTEPRATPPKTTAIFPLYLAAEKVPALIASLLSQTVRCPAIFIDNASTDGTADRVEAELARLGHPAGLRLVRNERNLGLSGSLNKAFAMVETPYALTCHSDCRFGQPDYLERMLELAERTPDAGSITGRPAIEPGKPLPLAEKINLVTNLMDLFPDTSKELTEVGFAEGRCDLFRMEALRKAGFYDTKLALAGEDQVLASKMRELGYRVLQAPRLAYYLSLSAQQDSLRKLPRHQRLFGRAHPYILLMNRGAAKGVASDEAGANRRARLLLRASQLAACAVYLAVLAWLLPVWALAPVFAFKLALFWKHLRAVRLTLREKLVLFGMQPVLDVSYTVGLVQGLAQLATKRQIW